jgi:hypothetical protein
MTTFTGPLNVKKIDSEVTVAGIDVSGTAAFVAVDVPSLRVGTVVTSGNATICTNVIQSTGTATFTDVDITQLRTGTIFASGLSTLGTGTIGALGTAAISLDGIVIVNADTTVVAQGTAAVIPASCEGYFTVSIGGTDFLVPYFTKA